MDAPSVSVPVLTLFRRIVRSYFRRHFHGVRISRAQQFTALADPATGPLLVYANHSSWWDPMVCFLLADRLMPRRAHYAPMDSDALDRYAILKRVGIFPVAVHTARGAVQFLRRGESILRGGGVLWVTPQGRFVDPRERPLVFKPGLAALAARVAASGEGCRVLPLAIEFPFWDERLPEALLHFGEAVQIHPGDTSEHIEPRLTAALEAAMAELQGLAMARDPRGFELLSQGTLGMGGFYALGKRAKAWLTRQPYQPEHTAIAVKREQRTGL